MKTYIETLRNTKVLYECSSIYVYGTQYKRGSYVLLPESTNNLPVFGKIWKLLACEEFCHLYYRKTKNTYCSQTDLFMVTEQNSYGIIRSDHLADYHILHGYKVGEEQKTSISLRNFVLEHL